VSGPNGLVTAGHPLASIAGVRVLMQGGTAADAAVAILATLNQVEPMMSGIGGSGFMTVYDKDSDRVYSLNATGAAPASLDASELTADDLARGFKAGVTPGLFGGWIALLDRFGTMTLGEVLELSVDYAERGHPLGLFVAGSVDEHRALLGTYVTTAQVFLPDGAPPLPGAMFTYPDLARTLRKLVEAEDSALANGRSRPQALRAAFDRFYSGDIAREMARFYQGHGGFFTRDDFAHYQPVWAEPVRTTYRGYEVYSSPPTSRGGLEVTMQLNVIEGFDMASLEHNSADALHLIAESIKVAKADVYHFVADPDATDVPMEGMLSKDYADTRRALIASGEAMDYPDHGLPAGSQVTRSGLRLDLGPVAFAPSYPGSTTSFSVADRYGNVVVSTPTLGSVWGTGVVVGTTGIILNNGTRHGSTSPYPDDVNYARGGQIPVLNNAPIVVMKDEAFYLALGTPGGEAIGQTQFQVLLNVLDYGMEIQEAIEAPRMSLIAEPNFYRPGSEIAVQLESRIAPDVVTRLEAMGHAVVTVPEYSIGNMQGILANVTTQTLTAGADPRRMMYAIGW
jgi:gamma-glutamyltranspeptidase/glutathione hydrolase